MAEPTRIQATIPIPMSLFGLDTERQYLDRFDEWFKNESKVPEIVSQTIQMQPGTEPNFTAAELAVHDAQRRFLSGDIPGFEGSWFDQMTGRRARPNERFDRVILAQKLGELSGYNVLIRNAAKQYEDQFNALANTGRYKIVPVTQDQPIDNAVMKMGNLALVPQPGLGGIFTETRTEGGVPPGTVFRSSAADVAGQLPPEAVVRPYQAPEMTMQTRERPLEDVRVALLKALEDPNVDPERLKTAVAVWAKLKENPASMADLAQVLQGSGREGVQYYPGGVSFSSKGGYNVQFEPVEKPGVREKESRTYNLSRYRTQENRILGDLSKLDQEEMRMRSELWSDEDIVKAGIPQRREDLQRQLQEVRQSMQQIQVGPVSGRAEEGTGAQVMSQEQFFKQIAGNSEGIARMRQEAQGYADRTGVSLEEAFRRVMEKAYMDYRSSVGALGR